MPENPPAEYAETLEKRIALQGKIAKLLSASLYDASQFERILRYLVEATEADVGWLLRVSELNEHNEGTYVAPTVRCDQAEIYEIKKRMCDVLDEKREDARILARAIPGDDQSAASLTLAFLLGTKVSREEATKTVDAAIEILGPIFRARIVLRRRDRERRKTEQELRSREEELRHLFDESRDMIYTANAEDRIASINAAGLELLGKPNRFDVLGKPFADFAYSPGDRDFFLSRIRKEGFIQDYEIVIARAKGDPAFCIETAHVIKRSDGSIAGIQGIVKDITDRINNEKELWKANLELATANSKLQETQLALVQQEKFASIGQLAAGIAHEINNPLGFLRSNHQSLKHFAASFQRAWSAAASSLAKERRAEIEAAEDMDYVAQELPRLFAESDDGFARIVEIVSQLKAFSRVDSEARKSPYDLEHGIESTLVVAWNELKYVAEVERRFGKVQPVEADGGAINQVLLNIFVNAAQAIASQEREDKGSITIRTREHEGFVECSISDDGPGMPDDVRRKVFDPFFTTKDPGKGTGLGLSISYDIIVNKHQGKITVDSEPGSGTTFTISLPIAPP